MSGRKGDITALVSLIAWFAWCFWLAALALEWSWPL